MTCQIVQRKQTIAKEDRLKNHFHAQKLNNIAASCIDAGHHRKAVGILVKALCLSPIDEKNNQSSSINDCICTCSRCSLDECIGYSEDRVAKVLVAKQLHQASNCCCCSQSKKRRVEVVPTTTDTGNEESNNVYGSYTHRKPIYVPPGVCSENHVMGSLLSLIVTFNLALASHLQVISDSNTSTEIMTEERRGKLLKVLRLYELAYRWQEDFCQREDEGNNPSCDSSCDKNSKNKSSSIRFDMIICNNLSEIHGMLGNRFKRGKSLEHLLSLMMFVVDWQRYRNFDDDSHEDVSRIQPPQQGIASQREEQSDNATADNKGEDRSEDRQGHELETERGGNRKRSKTYMQLDGFWRNITPLLLQNNCAEAA